MTGRQDRHRAGGWRIVGGAVALLIAGGVASLRGAELLDRVLAVVSGTVITLSDARAAIALGMVDTRNAPDPIETAMDWLVDRQVVLDEAAKSGIGEVGEAAIRREMEMIRRRFPSDADYRAALARLGLDDARAKVTVRNTLAAQEYMARRFDTVLPATEDELREFFLGHRDRFVRDGRQLTFEEAVNDVRVTVQEERRQQAVSAWRDRLRRRADVTVVYVSPRTKGG